MKSRIFVRLLPALLIPLVTTLLAVALMGHGTFGYGAVEQSHLLAMVSFAALAGGVAAGCVAWSLTVKRARRAQRFFDFANDLRQGNMTARLPERPQDTDDPSYATWNIAAEALEARIEELESVRLQLTTLLNSMQEGVIAVDRASRITWANRIVEQMAQQRVVLGASLVQTIRDPEVLECVQAALSEGTVRRQNSKSIQPGRTLEVTVGPMPVGAVAVLHDVTEVERMEATRRDFIANVSHELRTPLTSVTGYVETLLEDESFDDEKRDFLSIILKNARRMTRLTEDLLTLARVESGETKLHIEPVPASLLLTEAVDALGGLVDDHGMTLEIAFTTDTLVMADRDALHQVLSNLIENAAKYAPDGERILLGAVDRPDAVEVFVQDFGPGIRTEHLQRIFERFYRVDKARSMESGGTGLGLAIAKHIMLAHQGGIRVESALNRGCTFLLTLPLAEPAGQDAGGLVESVPGSAQRVS